MADLLDRTVQEVLGVQDKKLNESVKGLGETFKSAFDDLSGVVKPWVKDANSFYSKAEVANQGILKELSDLNGRISSLPSVISSAVDRTLKPLSKMETGLVTVTTLLPEIKDVLGTTRTSILELERLAGENSLQLDRLNDLVESKGPGWDFVYPEQPIAPEKPQDNLVQDVTVEPVVNPTPVNVDFSVEAPQSNVDVNVNPTPVNVVPGTADFTPNYTDTLNDVVSVITDIREQIQSFSGATAEDIYPNLREDLSGIAGAIEGFANANLSGGEIDLQGFISDVQEFVVDVSDGLVGSFVSEVVPEMAGQFGDFVDAYTESLLDAIHNQGDRVATAISDIGPTDLTGEYQPSEIQLDPSFLGEIKGILNDSKDGVGQFHEDTILWLENIDERLNKGFVSVSNTVSRSSARSDAISSRGFSDEIDSFDDLSGDTDRISIGGASYGAITAYQMVNHYPDYYAACVPVAGYDTVTSAFNNVAVWALHGDRDLGQGRTNYNVTVQRVNEINQNGGSAYLTTLKGLGHSNVHNKVYQNTFTTPDGDQDTPLEWAFKQSKSKNKAKKNGNTKTA